MVDHGYLQSPELLKLLHGGPAGFHVSHQVLSFPDE